MKNLMDAKGADLFWEQPNASQRHFVLIAEEDSAANLDLGSSFSTFAEAAANGGQWTFRREGCFSNQVVIRRAGSEIELATYNPRWTGTEGKIRFATGELYSWQVANFWSSRYLISDADGIALITYLPGTKNKRLSNIFKQQAQVVIAPGAWQHENLPILILLGWYLIILHFEDSSNAAVIASLGVLN